MCFCISYFCDEISCQKNGETQTKEILLDSRKYVILSTWEIHRAKGGFAPLIFLEVQNHVLSDSKEI